MSDTNLIYKKIPEVARAIGAIGKDRKNEQQRYSFRGIDDLYNALHGPMCDAGIFSTAEVIGSQREERPTKSGGNMIYTILTVRHTFYAEDGSNVSTVTVGEAMDSGDKSSNKSMSAAFKYALMELFCIPTEERLDTEYDSPETTPQRAPLQAVPPAETLASEADLKAYNARRDYALSVGIVPPGTCSLSTPMWKLTKRLQLVEELIAKYDASQSTTEAAQLDDSLANAVAKDEAAA